MGNIETLRKVRRGVVDGEMAVEVDERPSGVKARLDVGSGLTVTREEHELMNAFVGVYNEFLAELHNTSNAGERELTDEELGGLITEHSDGSEAFTAEYLAVFASWYSTDEEMFQRAIQKVED